MSATSLNFAPMNGFSMTVQYVDGDVGNAQIPIEHHSHAECEIYVNLGGDVSFMVEDQLYPIRYGNMIITRPYEYHHCIYHSKARHPHFWILFTGDGNERLLKPFFERRKGRHNLFSLGKKETQELVELCHTLCRDPLGEIDRYAYFFRLLQLLENAKELHGAEQRTRGDISLVLRSIHRRYGSAISVRELAEETHISVSTLERWFEENLHVTPTVYIRRIRLANAARMLAEQKSVTDTAGECGFSDVSAFIIAFKKQYGVTPSDYRISNGPNA